MVKLVYPQSYNGDSILNRCLYIAAYEKYFSPVISHMFRWTEPLILVSVCLVILLLLPLIFLVRPDDSYLKISRLYNVSRLSVLTFFHRVIYIYLIFCPLSLLINQQPPCRQYNASASFYYLAYFPSPKFASFTFACLYIGSLASVSKVKFVPIFVAINFLVGLSNILAGDLSVAQMLATFCLTYIIHFYSMRVPFWFLHVENIVLPILFVIIFILQKDVFFHRTFALGRAITTLSLWVANCYMLGRYHYTRAGFVSVGRPIDLEYEADTKSNAYFSILSSEEEDVFTANLRKDLLDSCVATIVYLVGLVLRYMVKVDWETSSSGLI